VRFRSCVLFLALCAGAFPGFGNLIHDENQKPGTTSWQLTRAAHNHEIEGYASLTSVARGGSIQLFVNTADPTYTINIFRMGWYGGTGGRQVLGPITRNGIVQPAPFSDPATGLIECNWSDPYTLNIPRLPDGTEWMSGVYLVKLTGNPSGRQAYILFVVRDDERGADLLFQTAVTTYQAYNNWGGKSLYIGSPQARKVSFDRPYVEGDGAGSFLRWDYNMVRFLEREGFDVAYSTNLDTHVAPLSVAASRGFLSVGHDEYWSWEMRQHLEQAIASGLDVAFFSGNNIYWQIRFENSLKGQPLRTMTSYKEAARQEDPFYFDSDPGNDQRVTTKFREPPVNRPEDAVVGVMYESGNFGIDADMVVEATSHWVFAGTGLRPGDKLPGLLGYEVDRMFGNAPSSIVRLAHSPFTAQGGETHFSDMTIYETGARGIVFATGSIQWAWGLDSYAPATGSRVHAAAQQITRNILKRMIFGPPTPRSRAVRR
jgi:hypothetical protein